MYRIVKKEALKPTVILYEIEAPMVAKKAQPPGIPFTGSLCSFPY